MTSSFAALYVRTVGSGSHTDEIVEAGVTRFSRTRENDTFHSLVMPEHRIPLHRRLTSSLDESDLKSAPRWYQVAQDMRSILTGATFVSADLEADTERLERAGVPVPMQAIDLLQFSRLLLWDLSEPNIEDIAKRLSVPLPDDDSALEHARLMRHILYALFDLTASIPIATMREIQRLGVFIHPHIAFLLEECIEASGQNRSTGSLTTSTLLAKSNDSDQPTSLTPNATKRPISGDDVERLLLGARQLPEQFPEFERRDEQLAMARATATAISDESPLIVEAGTGTGKSLAYLAPAALHALRNKSRVVISTNTISLQEQLNGKDIPILQALVDSLPESKELGELRSVTLKGRRNYLCLRKWTNLLRQPEHSPAEAEFMIRILGWLSVTDTGDRAELSLSTVEEPLWDRVSAGAESCFDSGSPFVRDGTCFVMRSRKRAEASHLVVVNHALLLSDLAAGGRVLPSYNDLVIDEAHNLEGEATRQFGFTAGESEVNEFLGRIHGQGRGPASGLASDLRTAVRGKAAESGPGAQAIAIAASLAERVERTRSQVAPLFRLLEAFTQAHAEESGDYDRRLLLTSSIRSQPDWSDVEIAWENVHLSLGELLKELGHLQTLLQDSGDIGLLDYETLVGATTDLLATGMDLAAGLGDIICKDTPERVSWLLAHRATGTVSVSSAPLDVSDLLRERLWMRKDSVVLTSATLSTEGRFDYIRNRLGLDEAEELLVGSPFDYARSTLLLTPKDMPDPSNRDYPAALADAVIDLCTASQGRALVLLTSYGALRALHRAIKGPLAEEKISVLGQGVDGSAKQLLQALRESPRTVVLGTASFWEGVDVAGEALSMVIIAKLPFTVPNDPIFVSRSRLFDNPFMEYALPEAVLRFKQGFGRLIRRKTDRGVMVILDPRVRTKRYGSAFLKSVPECTVREGLLRQFPKAVATWLGTPQKQ